MVTFNDAIMTLERLGISDVLLPFILIFTIVFAVMQKVQILGENKKFHAMVALVLALSVVIPHVTDSYPNPAYDVVNIINTSLPNVSVILVAVVAVFILVGVFGIKFPIKGESKSVLAAALWVAALVTVVFVFGSAAGWGWSVPRPLRFLMDPDTQALLVIILVFGAIIAYITAPEKREKRKFTDSMKNFINGITSEGSEGGSERKPEEG